MGRRGIPLWEVSVLLLFVTACTGGVYGARTGAVPPPPVSQNELDTVATRACAGLTCKNGGKVNAMSCSCDCPAPWSGKTCRTCNLSCGAMGELNSAKCQCLCKPGFEGKRCEILTGATKDTAVSSDRISMDMFRVPLQQMHLKGDARPELKKLWSELRTAAAGTPDGKNGLTPDELSLEEVSSGAAAGVSSRVLSASLVEAAATAAEESHHCNRWRYQVCKSHPTKEATGSDAIVMGEQDVCSGWQKAGEALSILALRPGTDDDKYLNKEILVKTAEEKKAAGTTASTGIPATEAVKKEYGYRVCFISNEVIEAAPQASGDVSVPVLHVKCTKEGPRHTQALWLLSKLFKLTTDEAKAANELETENAHVAPATAELDEFVGTSKDMHDTLLNRNNAPNFKTGYDPEDFFAYGGI